VADSAPRTFPLYFEDLTEGLTLTSNGRTITEADVVQFAMISGDWNPLHVDAEFAKTSVFGKRVVHGMAALSFMGGLMYSAGWFSSTVIALLGYEEVRFVAPLFIGDTIRCRMTVLDTRVTSSGRGLVRRQLELINQDGSTVQRSVSPILIAMRGKTDVG
jgi:acyl dehydratase